MTYHRKDLIVLAGDTLKWAAENDCVKDGKETHHYFNQDDWCTQFESSTYIFKKVKEQMIEIGIPISYRVRFGHYISDEPADAMSSVEVQLKNIMTRLETVAALCDSSQKSKHSAELMQQLREIVDYLGLQLDDDGVLQLASSKPLIPEAVQSHMQ